VRKGKLCQLSSSCAALTGCLSVSAFAADLPARLAPAGAPFTWNGYYAGANLGYGRGDPQITSSIRAFVDPGPAATGVLSSAAVATSNSSESALGGLQAGYNVQAGSWVYGIETDLSVTRLRAANPGLATSAAAVGGIDTASMQTHSSPTGSIDWFGTLRPRLGYAWNRTLIYGTVGLAYGSVKLADGSVFNGFAGSGTLPPDGTVAFSSSGTTSRSLVKTGWTAGGGADYAYTDNLILSLTYLHVDLGSDAIFSRYKRPSNILGGTSTTVVRGWTLTSTNFEFDLVRAAASWKF
jgi:outer membrane immunogenic protein